MNPFPRRDLSILGLTLAGVVLLALAAASYLLSFAKLGSFALPVALAIGIAKALVVLFSFMGFGKLKTSARLAAAAALFMLVLLVGLTVADVGSREPPPLAAPPRILSAQ
jgi:caa(3)-type oxidase subunit IV